MNRPFRCTAMVLAAALLASPAVYASSLTLHAPVNAMFANSGTVKLYLHNGSNAPVKVMAGTSEVTIAPGKTMPARVNVGDKIVAENDTQTFKAGTLLITAAQELNGATIVIR